MLNITEKNSKISVYAEDLFIFVYLADNTLLCTQCKYLMCFQSKLSRFLRMKRRENSQKQNHLSIASNLRIQVHHISCIKHCMEDTVHLQHRSLEFLSNPKCKLILRHG